MWVAKTKEEIEKEKHLKYFDFRKPLVCFLLLFLGTCSLTWFSYRRYPVPFFEIISASDYFNKCVPFGAFLGFLAFVFSYFWNIKYNNYPFLEEPVICMECSEKRISIYEGNCKCGGTFMKKAELKWLKE